MEEARSKQGAVRLIERIYEIKTGSPVDVVAIDTLPAVWRELPRKRVASSQYLNTSCSTLERFARFMGRRFPATRDLARVSASMARAFLDDEIKRGVAPKTWNDTLMLLRSAFKKLLPKGAQNPFADIPTKDVDTIYRKPFTAEELDAILCAARHDPELRPVIITGICTAMRRRDCCMLKWSDVDLVSGFLRVRTNKTREFVNIPILPLLMRELRALDETSSPFVFPAIAAKYQQTPLNISRRVRRVLAAAGFRDASDRASSTPGPKPKHHGQHVRGAVTAMRESGAGVNKVSIRDFHSFRVTWITLALSAGVSLELVKRVTGHKTTDIVLKHYFKPGQQELRDRIHSAMPALLTESNEVTKDQQVLRLIDRLRNGSPDSAWDELISLVRH